jgi:hypothetical protein
MLRDGVLHWRLVAGAADLAEIDTIDKMAKRFFDGITAGLAAGKRCEHIDAKLLGPVVSNPLCGLSHFGHRADREPVYRVNKMRL